MIREINKIWRLSGYGYRIKSNLVLGVVILAAGILGSFLIPPGAINRWIGSYLIVATAMCPVQMIYSVSASHMVQASVWNKKLQTTIPAAAAAAANFFLYLIILFIKSIQVKGGMYTAAEVAFELVMAAGLIFILCLYNGIAYKSYYLVTFLFFAFITVYSGLSSVGRELGFMEGLSLTAAVCAGFLAIAAGGAAQYGISLLTYKMPVDKNSQMTGLRRLM